MGIFPGLSEAMDKIDEMNVKLNDHLEAIQDAVERLVEIEEGR